MPLGAERAEVGIATRKERDLPAYVRVVVGRARGFGEEVVAMLGSEGVLSNRVVLVWLSRKDSVFERANIGFVGEEAGDADILARFGVLTRRSSSSTISTDTFRRFLGLRVGIPFAFDSDLDDGGIGIEKRVMPRRHIA